MNVYFFSCIETSVKCGDLAFKLSPYNVKAVYDYDIDCFIEMQFSGKFLPAFCNLRAPFTAKNMRIIDLFDGFLLIPEIVPLRNLLTKKIMSITKNVYGMETNFSVFEDGGRKLCLSSSYYHEEFELPFTPKQLEVFPQDNHVLLIALYGERTALLAVTFPEFELKLSLICDEFTIGEELSTISYHKDISNHKVCDNRSLKDFSHSSRKVFSEKKHFKEHEIPFAFLQEISLYGDYRAFLSNDLLPRASLIPEFIGKFEYIIPPFCPSKPNSIGLVNGNKLRFLDLSIKNNKITDLDITDAI